MYKLIIRSEIYEEMKNIFTPILIVIFGLICQQSLAQPGTTSAGFIANDSVGCPPLVVNFSPVAASNVANWDWDFGNGHTSTLQNPTESFANPGQYTITLTLTFFDGTTEQITKTNYIEVVPLPQASFSLNSYSPCLNDNQISFQNNSTNSTNYLWDFGDGFVSSQPNPVHHYNTPGTYQVNLIVSNQFGCQHNASVGNIQIHPVQQSNINLLTSGIHCDSSFQFEFGAANTGLSNYRWTFGDGHSAFGTTAQHTYNAFGNYNVGLITTDNNGCIDTTYLPNPIHVAAPVHDFSSPMPTTCAGTPIHLDAVGPNISSVSWDFGDGQSGNGMNTNHVYQNPGNYTIKMITTTPLGCVDTVIKQNFFQITPNPIANISVSDSIVCSGDLVYFQDQSINAASIQWKFGQQTNPSPAVTKMFNGNNQYPVRLIASSGVCADTSWVTIQSFKPIAQFQTTTSNNCAPISANFIDQSFRATAWYWEFENGNTSNQQNPQELFQSPGNFDTKLTVTDSLGCLDTIRVVNAVVVPNNVPANFTPSHFEGCSPMSLSFANYSIGNGSWTWNFGDGNTSTSATPTHLYQTPGEYIISLSTVDSMGCNIYIDTFATASVGSVPLDSALIIPDCQNSGIIAEANCPTCVLTNWSFGDGGTSNTQNSNHTYNQDDLYFITLSGTSANGCASSRSFYIDFTDCSLGPLSNGSASAPSPGEAAGWSGTPSNDTTVPYTFTQCSPFTAQIYNPRPNAQSWLWDFGDGTAANGPFPIHVYDNFGEYDLKLTYVDSLGITDTIYYNNYIKVNGHDNSISVGQVSTCAGLDISLLSNDSSLMMYTWNVDNNYQNSYLPNLDLSLSNNNNLHTITLTTLDTNYCNYSTSIGVVSQGYVPEFDLPEKICSYDALTIPNNIPSNFSVTWDFGDGSTSTDHVPNHNYQSGGTYLVSAIITDSISGCNHSTSVGNVEVIELNTNFSFTAGTNICRGDTIFMVAEDTTYDQYVWNLGSGWVSYNGPFAQSYISNNFSSGNYNVVLQITHEGCFAQNNGPQYFNFYDATADFSFTQDGFCFPIEADFTDLSPGAASWNWEFGDGTMDTTQNPQHLFTSNPLDSVTLNITDINGCEASITKSNVEAFSVEVMAVDTFGCAPAPIQFTQNSQNAIGWQWNFGDGNTSTLSNPTHTYTNEGIYDLQLIATSADGCTDTAFYPSYIQIDQITAGFSTNYGSGCAPQPAYFTDNSYNASSWEWNFGNGFTSNSQNPIQIYYVGGNYNARLIATSPLGCTDTTYSANPINIAGPEAIFSVIDSTVCSGAPLSIINGSNNASSYLWLFGNGDTSTLATPNYSYPSPGNYDITLITTDQNGCQHNMIVNNAAIISQAPDVNFVLNDSIGCSPLAISTSVPNNSFIQWSINGNPVTNTPSLNTSLTLGSYQIGVEVHDPNGCISTYTYDSVIVEQPFDASISYSGAVCESVGNITINAANSMGNWYVNGTINSTNELIDLSQYGPGNHQIVHEIEGHCGGIDSIMLQVDEQLTANIQTPASLCESDSPILLQSTNPSGVWLGNGITNGEFDPQVATPGNYVLTYQLTNGTCFFEDSTQVTVLAAPDANFNISGQYLCEGQSLLLTPPHTQSSTLYQWQFSSQEDTLYFETSNPQPELTPGTWNVSLIASESGCVAYHTVNDFRVYDTIAPHTPEIIRSTVVGDEFVYTEWGNPEYGEEKIVDYKIFRSEDLVNYTQIGTVGKMDHSFSDFDVDIFDQNYYYMIVPGNICEVRPELSDVSSSILLEKQGNYDDKVVLKWSEYQKWKEGVDYYEVQKKDENGNWVTIITVDGTEQQAIIEK